MVDFTCRNYPFQVFVDEKKKLRGDLTILLEPRTRHQATSARTKLPGTSTKTFAQLFIRSSSIRTVQDLELKGSSEVGRVMTEMDVLKVEYDVVAKVFGIEPRGTGDRISEAEALAHLKAAAADVIPSFPRLDDDDDASNAAVQADTDDTTTKLILGEQAIQPSKHSGRDIRMP